MIVDMIAVSKQRTGPLSRTESVLVSLREMITRGDYPPGFHLQEIPLAEALGVSRTPIKHALNMLAKEGLLDPGPKRGYKVRGFSLDEILKTYEVRGSLEGTACRLLAEKGVDEKQTKRLRELLEAGDDLLSRGAFSPKDQPLFSAMNEEIHGLIILGTENAVLQSFVAQVYRVPLMSARHVHWYHFDTENYQLARIAHSHHHSIIDAIIRRQSARAEAAMREHVYFSYSLVQQNFNSTQVGFDTLLSSPPRTTPSQDEEVRELQAKALESLQL